MKNKKFLCLVLALVMVLGAFGPVFAETKAADDAKKVEDKKVDDKKVEVKKVTGRDNKIQYLIDNKYVEGRKVNEDPKDNDLALDKTIKRSEITKLLVYAIGRQDLAEKVQGVKIYSDVEATYWANGVITVGTTMASPANNVAFLNGYPDGSFKPENDVTYGELAKMLVTLVKKDLTKEMHDKANKPGVWPAQWITWAADLGILEDVKIEDANKPAVRSDAFVMLYNALYALKYVKKYAATDELGILSQLKNKKLTLNQGDKKKEYTITDDTTFILYNQYNPLDVQADEKNNAQNMFPAVVKVGAIDNPKYYYGSLLRVITDDKGNVTHILELGNPRYLALGDYKGEDKPNPGSWNINPNDRWSGVAGATAETSKFVDLTKYLELVKENADADSTEMVKIAHGLRAAKFHFENGSAKEIAIYEGAFKSFPENIDKEDFDLNNFGKYAKGSIDLAFEAKLDKDTKYFVADVVANQLTQVDSVDEAIQILGLTRASNWFMDVYVGYDSVGEVDKHVTSKPTNIKGYNVAKVVVFNNVQKDNNNGQLLRVKNQATTLYDATLEKTDGTEVVFNLEKYRKAFPFDFKDAQLNVVEITENAAYGINVDLKIKHKDTDRYPIVKVLEVNSKGMIVEDMNEHTAFLGLAHGYDQFLEKQKLEGAVIQFHTLSNNIFVGDPNRNNVVDIVSILPKDTNLKGALQNSVEDNQGNQRFGWIELKDIDVSTGDVHSQFVQIKQYYDFYNTGNGSFKHDYWVDNTEANLLRAYLETHERDNFRYKVQKDANDRLKAFDFKVRNEADNAWIELKDFVPGALAVQAQIEALTDAPNLNEDAIKAARDAFDKLNADQKPLVDDTKLIDREDKVTDIKKDIDAEAAKGIDISGTPLANTNDLDKVLADAKLVPVTDTTLTRSNEALPEGVNGKTNLTSDPKKQTQDIKADFAKDGITVNKDVTVTYKVD